MLKSLLIIELVILLVHSSRCRDPYEWPFSASSIWNTPIGSAAVYHHANIYPEDSQAGLYGPPANFHIDQDWVIRSGADDPAAVWVDSYAAFPAPNCTNNDCCHLGSLPAVSSIPLPPNLFTDCVENNNGAAVLLPDGDTIVQFQPFYRPHTFGGPFMAWYHQGAPQQFPWNTSIRGDGDLGAHGGSGLSVIGGTVRPGELQPNAPPIAHALKIELWSTPYYYGQAPMLQPPSAYNGGRGQYVWPATGSDTGSNVPCSAGGLYCGKDKYLAPGSLLAVPPSNRSLLAAAMQTTVGRKLLDALTDYGAYIVDDTGSKEGGAAFCADWQVAGQVYESYGISLWITNPVTPNQGGALYEDLLLLYRSLYVVINNGPNSTGGGGIPRQPRPPPFC
jgi:hypothetical protein